MDVTNIPELCVGGAKDGTLVGGYGETLRASEKRFLAEATMPVSGSDEASARDIAVCVTRYVRARGLRFSDGTSSSDFWVPEGRDSDWGARQIIEQYKCRTATRAEAEQKAAFEWARGGWEKDRFILKAALSRVDTELAWFRDRYAEQKARSEALTGEAER